MSRESFASSESGLERTLPDTFSGGFPDVSEELVSHELDAILAENPHLLESYAEDSAGDSLN